MPCRSPLLPLTAHCALQVLEHAESPDGVLSEIYRVLRPAGIAFVSTHGVARYHANQGAFEDYWRWTHAGLDRLVRQGREWGDVTVHPYGGSAAALAYLLARQLEVLAAKARLRAAVRPCIAVLQSFALNLERLRKRIAPNRPPALAPNYPVVAVR